MTDFSVLTATATYEADEPTQGLHHMIDQARLLGAKVKVDSDQGDLRIVLTITGPREPGDESGIAQQLAELTAALPPRPTDQTSSWRLTGPVPF